MMRDLNMISPVRVVTIVSTAMFLLTPAGAESLKLPAEVTPALRAACEQDVRRLCIAEGATLSSVKSCVMRRYVELSARCKVQIAMAGLTPGGR